MLLFIKKWSDEQVSNIVPFSSASGDWRKNYRYAVYEHKLIAPNGEICTRSFIVIKNKYDVIVHFTNLHRFVSSYENKVFVPINSDAKNRMLYVCKLLNYIIIENYERFRINHIFSLTKESIISFLKNYAQEEIKEGRFRGEQSVERCTDAILSFHRHLYKAYGDYLTLKPIELYSKVEVPDRRGNLRIKYVPNFNIRGIKKRDAIYRDMPTKALEILLGLAMRFAPDISFALCSQAFAGLRAGEVLNMRQENSPAGRGIVFTYIEDRVLRAEIDVTKELPMRSDGVICGKIKKERKQSVYPPFLDAFMVAYKRHLKFLNMQGYEEQYAPMFVDKRGMAMTYDTYYRRFTELVENYFRPALISSEDPVCNIYGQILYENKIGLHVLRHWFSVQLVLHGEDIAQIQYWRGDKSPESAFAYLQNKGDLIKELELSNNALAEILMKQGEISYYEKQ